MARNVLVLNPYSMSSRQPSRGSKVGEGNISTNYLANCCLLSLEILLLDMVSASNCSLKCNMVRFHARNGAVRYLRMKYGKS
jgi:hypothetical protein